MSLLESAQTYYSDNTAAVDAIVAEIKAQGLDETALDEAVHEGAENGNFASEDASEVNNQGLALQVASILEGNGIAGGRKVIEDAVAESIPSPKR